MYMYGWVWLCVCAVAFAASESFAAVAPLGAPAMGLKVVAGEYCVHGRVVTVARTVGLPVDLPERVVIRGEQIEMRGEPPAAYHKGTVLRGTLGTVDRNTRVPMMIDPDSVVIRSARDPQRIYVRDQDYSLDPIWGGLCLKEGGAISEGESALADYVVHRQRIDAVQVSPDGVAEIKMGESVVVCPAPPEPDPGWTVIAHIQVGFRTEAITSKNIYPICSENKTWRDYVRVSGAANLARTRRLLRDGKPVTIVCWGDSVTAGGSASSPDRRYVDLFESYLTETYPEAKLNVINAGIGGSSTESRRAGFEREVLAYNPDLITVEFVNDCGLTPERILGNYAEFIERARGKLPDVEFVIITPHYMRQDWMRTFEAAVNAMRRAAAENGAALADATNVWANLRRVGIPYTSLLANEINHPNDLGHEFFAQCLMKLLEPGAR